MCRGAGRIIWCVTADDRAAQPPPVQLPGAGIVCPECGYDLQGITSERCPECGTQIDRASLAESRIPWENRRRIGRVRAYRRTVWLVIARLKDLAKEAARPVNYAAAQRFRWVTIGLVFLAIAAMTAVTLSVDWPSDRKRELENFASAFALPPELQPWVPPLAFLGFFLSLVVATGVPSYFFHPRSLPVIQQNRAVALTYYVSGMLTWVAAMVVLLWAAVLAYSELDDATQRVLSTVSLVACMLLEISAFLLLVAWWWKSVALLRLTTRCGYLRQIALGATMVICVPLGVVLVIGMPWLVGYVLVLLR